MRNLFKVCCLVVALGISTHGFSSPLDSLTDGTAQAPAVSHHTPLPDGEDSDDKSENVVSGWKAFTEKARGHLATADSAIGKAGVITKSAQSHLATVDTLVEKASTFRAWFSNIFASASEKL